MHDLRLVRGKRTRADIKIADGISHHTGPIPEKTAQALSWGADEHVLMALAAGYWLYARGGGRGERIASNHLLLTSAAVTLLPHVLKSIFDQKRPDRLTIVG